MFRLLTKPSSVYKNKRRYNKGKGKVSPLQAYVA